MDLVRLRIPYGFIRSRARLSWREVRFGLVHQLLDPRAPAELAAEQGGRLGPASDTLFDPAAASAGQPVRWLVEPLADAEPERPDAEIQRKWLYLVLAWLYEQRHQDPDPLQRVEEVHTDFGYPERVAPFVRALPMFGPEPGSRGTDEQRLFERWKRYLDDTAAAYAAELRE